MITVVPAVAGGIAGFAYARLAQDLPEDSSWPAIFGAAGAATAVLGVRLVTMFRAMYRDLRGLPPPGSDDDD